MQIHKLQQVIENDLGLIDLRPAAQFLTNHIRNSCSLPWQRLPQSMHELPANHVPIAILGDLEQLTQATAFLTSKGYQIAEHIEVSEELWHQASEQDLLETGCHSKMLWQANPLLTECIEQVEQAITGRSIIDLACGAGRDSVYLATRGWQVTAIDNKEDTLERCQNLSESSQVKLTTLNINLENQTDPLADLQSDLVLVMRYLHRPLFPAIDKLIKPGGALIYSTFMVGSEQYGSPRNPAYLLRAGELADCFSHYHILIDEQRELADGRPVALFVATKP